MRVRVRGKDRLDDLRGTLIVANHPSLIDVIVLLAHMPNARCVVKESVWRNPFFGRVVRSAGYIPSYDGGEVVDLIAGLLQAGETVLLFPEGTRTPRQGRTRLRRGAALALLRSGCQSLPVRLHMRPRFLARGDSMWSFPHCRIYFGMTVGERFDRAAFAVPGASERTNAQAGNALLAQRLGIRRGALGIARPAEAGGGGVSHHGSPSA